MRIELVTELSGKKAIGLSEMKAVADTDNIEALNLMGEWLMMGFECSPDVNYAAKCFEKAARMGHTQAMLNLGICYIEGHGVKKSFAAAERWIRAADELGDPEAEGVCEELYLSTIGNHKPDLRAFVDFIFTKLPKEDASVDADLLKRQFVAEYILEKAGKSKEEIEKLKDKVTENDILAYESMNDLYHGNDDLVEEDSLDKDAYCEFLVNNAKSSDRKQLITILKLLYHLAEKKSKTLKQEILTLGNECYEQNICKEDLTWYERATYDVVEEMLGCFGDSYIINCLDKVKEVLYAVEENELADQYAKCMNTHSALIKARQKLQKSNAYNSTLQEQWLEKFTSSIFQLEDEKIEELFQSALGDYNTLVQLYDNIKTGLYENAIQKKWTVTIKAEISSVQENNLKALCENLDSQSYEVLVKLYDKAEKEYNFDEDILNKYLIQIAQPIDKHEIVVLEELCANTDDLRSSEYSLILSKIEVLKFKPSNAQKYISAITEKLKNTLIVESCDEEKLVDYDIDKLNDKIKAIHFSTLPTEQKKNLSQRLTYYIDLIYECKDKFTVDLLEKCSPENISKQSLQDLKSIKIALENHQRLDEQKKAALLSDVKNQTAIVIFNEKIEQAGADYDALIDLHKKLNDEKIPSKAKEQFKTILRTKIVSAQNIALNEICNCADCTQHSSILKRMRSAEHFSFDSELNEQAMNLLTQRLDEIEKSELSNICLDFASASIEEIDSMHEKIGQLDFKKVNIEPFMQQLNSRYDDLRFNEIVQKCTTTSLMKLVKTKKEVENILSELKNSSKDKADTDPYIKRLTAVVDVKKALEKEEKDLYNLYFSEVQSFVVEKMGAIVFPQYSRSNVSFVFEPEKLAEMQSKIDKFKLEHFEKAVLLIDDHPGFPKLISGVCITNFAVRSFTDFGVKNLPLENIFGVKTGKIFETTTISGSTENIKFSMSDDYEIRDRTAIALWDIIIHAQDKKRIAHKADKEIILKYASKYEECFKDYPIPCDEAPKDLPAAQKTEENAKENIEMAASKGEENLLLNDILPSESVDKIDRNGTIAQQLAELLSLYGTTVSSRTLICGRSDFASKIGKAVAAYAPIRPREMPLLMEDFTIFGSAKEGFVWTNENIYRKEMLEPKEKFSIDDISDFKYIMKAKDLYYVEFVTPLGSHKISMRSTEIEASKTAEFYKDVLALVKELKLKSESFEKAPSSTVETKWLCACGNVCNDKFCSDCGRSRETGTPLWSCSCGTVNTGEICSNCKKSKINGD